jgi:O-antigen ligase
MHPAVERWRAWALPALLFLLPFEPRTPAPGLGGFRLTMLELAALGAVLACWPARAAWSELWRRLPLVLLAAYAAAHLLSALTADVAPGRSLRFALRMVAMAVLGMVVAAAPLAARLRALAALAAGGVVVAGLAFGEAQGMTGLDPFLDRFREQPFNVGGIRRGSGASEYPNLAAACLAYALVAGAGWAAVRGLALPAALALAVVLSSGLMSTHSRGALVAAALGLLALAVATRDADARRAPLATLAALGVTAAAFSAGREITGLRLVSEGVSSWYGAAYEPLEPVLRLPASSRTRTSVRVTNLGKRTWRRSAAFHLSHHWYAAGALVTRDGLRTPLTRDVGPRESVLLEAELQAPATPGEYVLLWDMVQEHTSWFSGQGVAPARVAVHVEPSRATGRGPTRPGPSTGELEGAGWRPGRAELWRIALLLWRERPLLGVGSDNYRWLYGRRAGRGPADTRVYANNLFLEALATTGLLGALALVGMLAATGFRAWQATGGAGAVPAATLLGLLTVVVSHGLVDYVLAFTGHYVFLGYLVGSVAALPVRTEPGC